MKNKVITQSIIPSVSKKKVYFLCLELKIRKITTIKQRIINCSKVIVTYLSIFPNSKSNKQNIIAAKLDPYAEIKCINLLYPMLSGNKASPI